ncbi:MAG: hypothetical protein OXC55_08475 [Chloroflexi bacterium]|nr:hypothetical protein [Chloroflexota bacterium]
MCGNDNLDPRTLSFSQANGYEPLPQPLALGEISDQTRRKLWDLLYSSAWEWRYDWDGTGFNVAEPWTFFFEDMHTGYFERPLEEFGNNPNDLLAEYRAFISESARFNKLFDLWQMIMRHPRCPRKFVKETARIFEECRLAYVVDTSRPPTILPAATPQEGTALVSAMKQSRESRQFGAETHLREAATRINAGEWAESVRESIHAVESVARKLDPKHANTLDSALKSLEKQVRIHPALRDAFGKLYGYTSDEDGVRHSLLESSASPVGRDEAAFMLGACASFVTYLLSKSRADANS